MGECCLEFNFLVHWYRDCKAIKHVYLLCQNTTYPDHISALSFLVFFWYFLLVGCWASKPMGLLALRKIL